MREHISWLFSKLSHAQDTIIQESADCAKNMDSATKMSTVVYKWICSTTNAKYIQT
jgi:hypothetical protein